MKTFLKKYAIAILPVLLLISAISIRPNILKASGCIDATTKLPADCSAPNAMTDPNQGLAPTDTNSNVNPSANPSAGRVTGNPKSNNPTPSYTLLEPLPCIPSAPTVVNGKTVSPGVSCPNGNGNTVSSIDFQQYVQYFFNLVIALSAAAAVFMIAAGGLRLMTTDSWTGKEAGKKQVWNAVIGLIIVLFSFFMLKLIDPRLVAIPTTLVPPLSINYSGQTNSFLNTLDTQTTSMDATSQQTADLVNQANQLRDTANAAQNTIVADQSKAADLRNEIANAIDPDNTGNLNANDIDQFCNSNSSQRDQDVSNLCNQLTETNQEINNTQANQTAVMAQGNAYDQVEQCLGIGDKSTSGLGMAANQTMDECLADINKTIQTAANSLYASGQPVLAQQVQDQGVYAQTIAKINNAVVSNMTEDPQDKAVMNTATTVILGGSTAVGAVAGGGVPGAVGGAVVGSLINGALKGADAADQAQQAQAAINQIENAVALKASLIQNSDLRNQLISQASAVVKSLGGTMNVNGSGAGGTW